MQIRQREQQQEELRQQASRPFARTADDADRDMNLRERVRFGDPFADRIQRAQPAAMPAPIVPAHMRKQMKKSGFVVPSVRPLIRHCSLPSMALSFIVICPAVMTHSLHSEPFSCEFIRTGLVVARISLAAMRLEERQGPCCTSSVAWGLLMSLGAHQEC